MALDEQGSSHRSGTVRDAVVTLAAVALAFGAVDDITTDSSSGSFLPERIALALCGLWFGWLSWQFVHRGRRVLGLSSFTVLILSGAGLWRLNLPSMASWADYIATVLGLIWFLGMGAVLVVQARRSRQVDQELAIH